MSDTAEVISKELEMSMLNEPPAFTGSDGAEAEVFIQCIRKRAFDQVRHKISGPTASGTLTLSAAHSLRASKTTIDGSPSTPQRVSLKRPSDGSKTSMRRCRTIGGYCEKPCWRNGLPPAVVRVRLQLQGTRVPVHVQGTYSYPCMGNNQVFLTASMCRSPRSSLGGMR